MDYEQIVYDKDGAVLTISLNRPDQLNAFTGQMMGELIDAFDRADADDEVRAVIVTGRGRGFCAGADLSGGARTFDHSAAPGAGAPEGGTAPRDGGGLVSLRIFESTKPVIAAINGPAVGVGITMTLPAASSWFLPRLVGISRAMEWVTTGRVFPAEEAEAAGLVRSVHPAGELVPAARAIADEIVANTSAVSVAVSRQMLWRMLGADHPMEAHKVDSRAIFALGQGADAREGVLSFLEKRPPVFPSRVSKDLPAFYPWWDDRPYG